MNGQAWESALADWRAAVESALEREGDDLQDIPFLEDPKTCAGREAVVQAWSDLGKTAWERGWTNAATRLVDRGIRCAESFQAAEETDSKLRDTYLGLLVSAVCNANDQGAYTQGGEWAERGIALAEKWLAGEKPPGGLHVSFLRLLANAVGNANARDYYERGGEWAERGIALYEELLAAGALPAARLHQPYLALLVNAVGNANARDYYERGGEWAERGIALCEELLAGEKPPGWLHESFLRLLANAVARHDDERGGEWVERGIVLCEELLAAGALPAARLNEPYLMLLANAVAIANDRNARHDYERVGEWVERGIALCEELLAGKKPPGWLHERFLRLLVDAVRNANARGTYTPSAYEQGGEWAARGIALCEELLAGKKPPGWLHEAFLALLGNAVNNANARGAYTPSAYERGGEWVARGIALCEELLVAGEEPAGEESPGWLHETFLALLGNALHNASARNDYPSGDKWAERGITLAEKWLAAGEEPDARGAYLHLLGNAVHYADARHDHPQGGEWAKRCITLAEQWLDGEKPVARLQELYLSLLANAVDNADARHDHPQGGEWAKRGITLAEKWLAAGEEPPGRLHEPYLRLLVNSVRNANARHDQERGGEWAERGIALAESLFAEGRNDARLHELFLMLHVNASAGAGGRGYRNQAVALAERGIAHAGGLFAMGQNYAWLHVQIIKLFQNVRANWSATALLPWIALMIWCVRKTGKNPDVAALQLFSTASGDRLFVHDRFLEELFIEWYQIDFPHNNLGEALDAEGGRLSPTRAAISALEGLVLWRDAEENARTRRLFTKLLDLNDAVLDDVARSVRSLRERRRTLRVWSMRSRGHWGLGFLRPWLSARLRTNWEALRAPPAAPCWKAYQQLRSRLSEWVGDALVEGIGWAPGLTEEAEILLAAVVVTTASEAMDREALLREWLGTAPPWRDSGRRATLFQSIVDGWPDKDDDPLDRWLETLGVVAGDDAKHLHIAEASRRGPAPLLTAAFSAAAEGEYEQLAALLDQAWSRVRARAEVLHRLVAALDAGEGVDAVCPPLADCPVRSFHRESESTPEEGFLKTVLRWRGLKPGFGSEAELLLGALFGVTLRRLNQDAREVLRGWRNTNSWPTHAAIPSGLTELCQAWFAASAASEVGSPIRRWLDALELSDELKVDAMLARGGAPVLERVFRTASAGDMEPLRALLAEAWKRAQRRARYLARVRVFLEEGWINVALDMGVNAADYTTAKGHLSEEQQDKLYMYWVNEALREKAEAEALRALLAGQVGEYLRESIQSHFEKRANQSGFVEALAASVSGRQVPRLNEYVAATLDREAGILPTMPLVRLAPALGRLYAAAVHRHPGHARQGALTERLHQWSRAALRVACASDDREGIWSALETGRVALSGLAVSPPDATWMEETARSWHGALHYGVRELPDDSGWQRGWPPLTAWINACARLRPTGVTERSCRARLRPGEALAQPYFVPETGSLEILWLTRTGALQRREFGGDCAERLWRETVLDPWAEWLVRVSEAPEVRVWRKAAMPTPAESPTHADDWRAILTRSPVRCFAETLTRWAREEGVERLLVLLPAPLAQLPWESLPESPWPAGFLVRLVALAHWRTGRQAGAPTERWTFYENEDENLRFARLEALRVDRAPWPNSRYSSADVLSGLRDHAFSHVILHGRYQRFAPLRSGLNVRAGQFLPLWVPAAIGIRAELLVLSACESNLSGQATEHLLGPVGIGPACVAAGARAVLGTLWPCHDLATLAFIDHLQRVAEEPEAERRMLQGQVAEAAQRLRLMGGSALRDLVARLVGEGSFPGSDKLANHPDFARERPYEEPKFWAPYVVIGEWPPVPTTESAEPESIP